jgi:deoxyhypusine synthase
MKDELKKFLTKKVKAIEVKTPKKISQLLSEMKRTGFQGRKLAEVVEIIERMIKEKDLMIILGYAGSLSTTGQWKIINWLIENRYLDVLVATGANLSEDIVEAMGKSYYQGSHLVSDEILFKLGLNRYYDVYGREDDYLKMTELIADFILTLNENYNYSSREFLALFGDWLWKKGIKSIVATAAYYKVPVFCPAIVDSPYGDAGLIAKSKGFNLILDNMKDYVEFMSLGGKVKKTGVIYIGGGVPKDFIQLLAVTSDLLFKDKKIPGRKGEKRLLTDETYYPHKYAVQITTDSPQWGGLSGATLDEGVSWGKEVSKRENYAQCFCDATIALPIIAHALAEKKIKRKGITFNF